jgi:hypothetical protein
LVWTVAIAAFVVAAMLCGRASAEDLAVGLSEAESRAAAAESEVADRKAEVEPVRSRYAVARERAAPLRAKARHAAARAATLESQDRAAHRRARAAVQAIEDERRDAAADHSKDVRSDIGLGIAALVLALLVLAWGWFRATAAVAYLVRIELGQAIGLCVGGGIVAIVVGAALSNVNGAVGALGFALASLGLSLPIMFLAARHSAEVQRGRARALLGRERMNVRVTQVLGILLAFLFLFGIGSGIFAGESQSREVSAKLQREAEESEPTGATLARAETEAEEIEDAAASRLAVMTDRRADLRTTKRALGQAETRLRRAEADREHFEDRIEALRAREAREQKAEERRAAKQAAQEEREGLEELESIEEQEAEECNPNYSGCLDPYASDYDCEGGSGDGPLYTGTVEVKGYDEYGLDDDGDGIGCDP